ncbi:MAG: hypothetical protein JWQ49_4344 [Edaphobacter sp.]|nr:hypothetical protein [Edaphobacter sp.]
MALSLHGMEPTSVFRLCGANENSASFALGWTLEQSRELRQLLIDNIFGPGLDASGVSITLQKHDDDGGFTDVELQAGHRFHAILEAKRYWELPGLAQLNRYLPRLVTGGAEKQRIVTLSAAHRIHAQRRLPADLSGVALSHLSWGDLYRMAGNACGIATRFEEKLWLRQLIKHLQEFTTMERGMDSSVFVVVLGDKPMIEGQAHTWIDVVEKDQSYFHPVGNHWPVQPVNYIGFRYRGRLQSVHHVDSFEIFEDVSACNSKWVQTSTDHFVYRLGPPMRPAKELKTGNLFMNQQVRCAIDTLLSGAYETIREARDETDRRNAEVL